MGARTVWQRRRTVYLAFAKEEQQGLYTRARETRGSHDNTLLVDMHHSNEIVARYTMRSKNV